MKTWRELLAPRAVVACAILGSSIGAVSAQPAASGDDLVDERFAFESADTDADGMVSLPELARDAAHGFAALDNDGDGKLKPGDLAPHDPAQFAKVDANADGVLTFTEVMTNKARAIKAGDKDQDGGLSFDEMVEIVQIETGGAS